MLKVLSRYFKSIFEQYKFKELCINTTTITLILVIIDYFSGLTFIYNKFGEPVILCCIILMIIKILSLKPFSLLILKSVCYIDFYSIVLILSTKLYEIFLNNYQKQFLINEYKINGCNWIFKICGIVLVFRYLYITIVSEINRRKSKNNVFDLQELYNNSISTETEFIYICDEDVDYDLLERDKIITQIANTINNCNNKTKFVISLKGTWGNGKTTILNNVKKYLNSKEIIYINDFEPWIYNDEKSLLMAFFDSIMKKINCGFRINDINIFNKTYVKTITSNLKYNFDELFNRDIDVERIKKIINNYLECNNKRIVLVLDNLERCSSEQILFILKTIHNLFDFNRIIYILSYDETIMKKIFETDLELDYAYLEKIVQLEFRVPKIEDNILRDIISVCLKNYLSHSKQEIQNDEIDKIVDKVVNIVKDLRDLKRIINSTFYASFQKEQYLNCIDMFLIETISLKNPELWQEISNHRNFFISEDRFVYENEYIYDAKKYNIDTRKYYDDLFENNKFNIKDYESILSYMFPNVEKYMKEKSYKTGENRIQFVQEQGGFYDKENYRKSIIKKRIFNGKFFELYFNKTENEFVKIDKAINKFILELNKNNYEHDELMKNYLSVEKIYKGWVERYTLETFQININKINKNKLLCLLNVMYQSYNKVDDTVLFLRGNARLKLQVIISDIITLLTDEDFDIFSNGIKNDYKNLYLIRELIYWQNPEKNEEAKEERYNKLKEIYESMINQVKENKINMYDNENYNTHNMIMFFDDETYMEFIKQNLNINNLMLFIVDCISCSNGSYGFGYKFDVEKIDKIYGWENAKSDLEKCPDSELKKFLIKAITTPSPYQSVDEKYTYHTNEWIELDELVNKYLNRE